MGKHEHLGKGIIGADALREVVRHPLPQNLPFILETPNDDKGCREEIQTVCEWMILTQNSAAVQNDCDAVFIPPTRMYKQPSPNAPHKSDYS